MNALEYFLEQFPNPEAHTFVHEMGHPNGDDVYAATLSSMPIDSPCGGDCKQAIDNAKAFADNIETAFGRHDFGTYASHLGNLMRVLSCYICG